MTGKKLGKGREIFEQAGTAVAESQPEHEVAEKTIFMIRPPEREALEEFVMRSKRNYREINNSMVVRCLLSVFAAAEVSTEGVDSEEMLKDRIMESLSSISIGA